MDRKVVITGASGGIGLATAKAFLDSGDKLFLLASRNAEVLEVLKNAHPERVTVFQADLARKEEVLRAAEAVQKTFGAPDILVHAAGIAKDVLFQESSEETYETLLSVNVSAAVRLTKALLPGMIRRHSGRILFVSSVFGSVGASMEVEYSLTKGAVDALTRSLAKEVAPSGIAVNAVAPGLIDTKMNACYSEEEFRAIEEEIPMGRAGTPEEVGSFLHLLSEAPLYLTGQVIRFDGGWI